MTERAFHLPPVQGSFRHCEERSDEAIQSVSADESLDCFASLAMTAERALIEETPTW
ncbi:hypothetical protein I6F14_06215 [Bradyrhizobium sp. IC3069]|uniref:hypothetical protein n=1 Tax=unclassified Bradyrhizobium TaxID=2631580 RepID=UPI001CD5B174|nr:MULTISPECIES: hypothetical protein [unclassified Bradyrhizobium]MCA1379623.1 hypothetical protein [Bradyrhizobium sp. BRP05]MCA1359000.1 hypothetical protein [Bradyrhizobium sp. IC4059]MCA1420708.1 hypothetical protein [Bradyrhizobium sp. BRP23]MCA1475960.1 hypothetical protein [Bradyrhizobium sp. NBAIM08]MCA1509919.1 hypothetical protein [Bradyrhizobium sp. NBAIM01]